MILNGEPTIYQLCQKILSRIKHFTEAQTQIEFS